MSICAAQSIPEGIVTPWVGRKTLCDTTGMSYGLSCCGYDVRLKQDMWIMPQSMRLGSTVERFQMPDWIMARVCDKSTLARRGIQIFNTVIEPGWEGWLTLEIKNQTWLPIRLWAGQPIAQIIFETLDQPTNQPYSGKYQCQPDEPVEAVAERG